MGKEIVEQFGKLLMSEVRDSSIIMLDKTLYGELIGQTGKNLDQYIQALPPASIGIIRLLIPLFVDVTLQLFLSLIEKEQALDLVMITPSGPESIKSASAGLSDELYYNGRWIVRFSQQRNLEKEIFSE